jgi:GntR family transcriptional regulator
MLNRQAPLPLHYQLQLHLLERIESGELKPDQKLEPEDLLARRYGVSRITVRRALFDLARAGYVRREQGRGTFVNRLRFAQGPRELTSFTEEMRRHGRVASSRVLSQGVVLAEEELSERLKVPAGTEIFRLERLRLADGEPMGLQRAHIPLYLAPGLASECFEARSLYEILRAKYGLCPARATECHYAVSADSELASLLQVSPGSPVLAAERVTFLADGRILEFVESAMRADRYKIVLELVADRAEPYRKPGIGGV